MRRQYKKQNTRLTIAKAKTIIKKRNVDFATRKQAKKKEKYIDAR